MNTKPNRPTIIITGASAGIGAAAARKLATDARVIIVGRSEATKAVADEIGAEYFRADFADLTSVRKLAEDLLRVCPRIDLLVNNAGGIMSTIAKTKDGFETTFQVNYLAQFLLTNLLMDRLITSKAGIINTSSVANQRAKLSLDDLQAAASPFDAYANGKLLDIMHAKQLSRRYAAKGVTAVSFHPGVVATNFASETSGIFAIIYNTPLKRLLISPDQGADTLVWLAQNRSSWQPGGYYVKRKLARFNSVASDANNLTAAWDETTALIR